MMSQAVQSSPKDPRWASRSRTLATTTSGSQNRESSEEPTACLPAPWFETVSGTTGQPQAWYADPTEPSMVHVPDYLSVSHRQGVDVMRPHLESRFQVVTESLLSRTYNCWRTSKIGALKRGYVGSWTKQNRCMSRDGNHILCRYRTIEEP